VDPKIQNWRSVLLKRIEPIDQNLVDQHYMTLALDQAKKAFIMEEVPVGAVVVEGDSILSRAHNAVKSLTDPSCHAELLAIRLACKKKKNYRLNGATLYVTIEPCTMCFGILIHARIKRLVFGALELKAGVLSSRLNLNTESFYNHKIMVTGGVLASSCSEIMSDFFSIRR